MLALPLMSPAPLSFDKAEYADNISTTVKSIDTQTYTNAPATTDAALFSRALLFGVGGSLAGAAIYAGFIGLTHINIGYLAILVAYLVAKAMTIGSRGRGGREYQVAALCLTYLAVSAARAALVWWQVYREDHASIPMTAHNVFLLAKYGVLEPFMRFRTSPGSALIGLFILFIGMRAAWRMTSGLPGVVQHPFAS